jgi:hypothetical protein
MKTLVKRLGSFITSALLPAVMWRTLQRAVSRLVSTTPGRLRNRSGGLLVPALLTLGMSCLLIAADDAPQKVRVTKTDRLDLPAGGVLHLKNSYGDVAIEGWDKPGVEITTIRSSQDVYAGAEREKVSHELEKVRITTERRGDEVLVTTALPLNRRFPPPYPFQPATSLDLEYRIRAPRATRIVVEHQIGEVHVENVTSDISVTVLRGQVTLRLPPEGRYAIDARNDFGSVDSDFPGKAHRRRWLVGHQFLQGASPDAHKLHLRVGFGDITILKIRTPVAPLPLTH